MTTTKITMALAPPTYETAESFLQAIAQARWQAEHKILAEQKHAHVPKRRSGMLNAVKIDACELVQLSFESALLDVDIDRWNQRWSMQFDATNLDPNSDERFVDMLNLLADRPADQWSDSSTLWQPLTASYKGPLRLALLRAVSRFGLNSLDLGLLSSARNSDITTFLLSNLPPSGPLTEAPTVDNLDNWVSANTLADRRHANNISIVECTLTNDCDQTPHIHWLTQLTWLLVNLQYVVIRGASFQHGEQVRAWVNFISTLHSPLCIEFQESRNLAPSQNERIRSELQEGAQAAHIVLH